MHRTINTSTNSKNKKNIKTKKQPKKKSIVGEGNVGEMKLPKRQPWRKRHHAKH
jgi:hypothetical protein